jgi:hypothetical protein
MMQDVPDLTALVQPLLGTPYQEGYCWQLARDLIAQGFGIAMDENPVAANTHLCELWYLGDTRDPLRLVRPWDLWIVCEKRALPISTHVGVVVDAQTFVHARQQTSGVAIDRLRLFRPKLLQIARLRRLC